MCYELYACSYNFSIVHNHCERIVNGNYTLSINIVLYPPVMRPEKIDKGSTPYKEEQLLSMHWNF